MLSNFFPTIITYLVVLLVGIFLGTLLIHLPYLSLDEEVNFIELANFILVFCLAILAPMYIDRKRSDHRSAKDLLIEDVQDFISALSHLNQMLNASVGEPVDRDFFIKVNLSIKNARQDFAEIAENSREINCVSLEEVVSEVDQKLSSYWNVLTGDDGLKPNNSRLKRSLVNRQDRDFEKLKRLTKRLKFTINSAW